MLPFSVKKDSGWNWNPYILFWLSSSPIGIFVLLHLMVILIELDLNGSINFNEWYLPTLNCLLFLKILLSLFKYKRVEPNYKNLYYKKILAKLSKVDSTKFDIALVAKDKILETGTSNLVFVKNGKIFSPKKNCYFGNTLKFISKKIKINFKDILIKSINDYEEIILIGSGKGVTSVSKINDLKWKRRKTGCYTKLNKIYNSLV